MALDQRLRNACRLWRNGLPAPSVVSYASNTTRIVPLMSSVGLGWSTVDRQQLSLPERRKIMKNYFKTLVLVAAIIGLCIPAVALAQKSAGGVVGEARLHPGTWNGQRSSRSYARSRPMYRSTAPVIVRTEPAPSSVAQAPTERRSYSYEPSQRSTVNGGCNGAVIYERAPAAEQRSTETRRSYSYEPSINQSYAAPRSYSAPRMRSSGSWSWQSGSKSERNNYRNR